MPRRVTPEVIAAAARLADLEIPEGNLAIVVTILEQQLAAVRRLSALDLAGVEVETAFDPRWEE